MSISLPSILDTQDKNSAFINCMRNNYRHIKKWAKRTETNCFRLYDRELTQFPVAIDFYNGRYCIHYFSSSSDNNQPDHLLRDRVENALIQLLGASTELIYWRTRQKSKESRQYEKQDQQKIFFNVVEYGVKFRVNLTDYIDTGLFLDHRETRHYIAKHAAGKKVLNLFAYTCSFSVHAAVGGAVFTQSVDISNTYTQWGKENFLINSLSLENHSIIRADCLKFLKEEVRSRQRYDLIIIDPPTISRSKKMDQLFDIQIDYVFLLNQSLKILNEKGIIFFSTNSKKFCLDESLFPTCQFKEISHCTIPIDFRNKKIHRCWKISFK